MEHHFVVRLISQVLIPVILLYALYVQFHGDYGPGGGFQAGVIFGAGFYLYGLVFGIDALKIAAPERMLAIWSSIGLLLYAGVGVVSMLNGYHYLDYNAFSADPKAGQHIGILLVELGVGITVAAVVISFFHCFVGYRNDDDDDDSGDDPHAIDAFPQTHKTDTKRVFTDADEHLSDERSQ